MKYTLMAEGILAGLDGVELANQSSNFQSTHSYINNAKKEHSTEKFLNEIVPNTIARKKNEIEKNQARLEKMSRSTPEERNKHDQLKSKIEKNKKHIEALESIDHNQMRKADQEARTEYNKQINTAYYTSSKFFKSTALSSVSKGVRMGARQAIGLVLAEIWFELKDKLPKIYSKVKETFCLESFIRSTQQIFQGIWQRVQRRFKDLLSEFKGGVVSGVLSSLTEVTLNIFMTTQRIIGKLLREMWNSLVSAAKLIFFNPKKLEAGDLTREVVRILSLGVSVAIGAILNQYLSTVMTIPFGIELSAFISAVVTGIITLGMTYFLDHSELMNKVWDYLNKLKTETRLTLEYYQKVNAQLDQYLVEISSVEFNLSANEIADFINKLESVNYEHEASIILNEEVNKRNIELPFESGNLDSTRKWLSSL